MIKKRRIRKIRKKVMRKTKKERGKGGGGRR